MGIGQSVKTEHDAQSMNDNLPIVGLDIEKL